MTETEIDIGAPVDQVFAVLADPRTYPDWLVGAQDIREVEGDWPAPGAAFHHTVGAGPIRIPDSTTVLDVDPPRRLVLRARARPTGVARVEFHLEPRGAAGAHLCLREAPTGGPAAWLWRLGWRPLLERGLRVRNEQSLDRLRRRFETGGHRASTSPGSG